MNKRNLTIILLLMIVSGILIYYLYLKPETFGTSDPTNPSSTTSPSTTTGITCPPATPPLPASILSRYFGVGFNIYPVNDTTAETLQSTDKNAVFVIEHIPVVYNGSVGSMYSVSNGQLTLKLRNDFDQDQWWIIKQKQDSSSNYYMIIPFSMSTKDPQYALQYENGNLALRPINSGFESQKWILSNTKITRGIPALNYGPASLFTPEFNPYASSSTTNTSLSQQNNQQVNDVVNLIKSNIQQYIATISGNQSSGGNIPPVSASSLGNKDLPLNINVNLGGASTGSGISTFDNVSGSTTGSDLLSLLNRYETTKSGTTNMNQLFTGSDLQSALQTNQGCSSVNIGDYTSNRVSTCNCKL